MASSPEPIGTAVVGYGYAGRCFHSYLVGLAEPSLRLIGVVSSRTEARTAIENDLGVRAYERFEQVLDDEAVELVVLATPNDVHASQAIAALESGRHVVTDKPMCLDGAQARAMMAAERASGRRLSVFQNRRWDGDYLTVLKALDDGLLGDLAYVQLAWGQYGPPRSWRGECDRGGGKFVDLGAHMIDQALQLADGLPERVFARFYDGGWENDVEDHAHCTLSFPGGLDIHVITSSMARAQMPRWYLLGTEAALVKEGLDPQEAAMVAGDIDSAQEKRDNWPRLFVTGDDGTRQEVLEPISGRWRSYYENVAAAIRGEAELTVTSESACRVMDVLDAAKRSARTGESVTLDGFIAA
ncbi:MAG: Gfo/Idh/MocA family oxidoreductase [Candidatus Latescibacterota bacterium]|nr:Gfo/Idh/MocA family oxidoreductase [Candidatus Latescibacterota bacterium]